MAKTMTDAQFKRELQKILKANQKKLRASLVSPEVTRLKRRLRKMDLQINDIFVKRSALSRKIKLLSRNRR